MGAPHHAVIKKTNRGWVVECAECRRDAHGGQSLPVGIAMLLESRETAERIWENHTGHRVAAAS